VFPRRSSRRIGCGSIAMDETLCSKKVCKNQGSFIFCAGQAINLSIYRLSYQNSSRLFPHSRTGLASCPLNLNCDAAGIRCAGITRPCRPSPAHIACETGIHQAAPPTPPKI